jgi:Peptidase family C25
MDGDPADAVMPISFGVSAVDGKLLPPLDPAAIEAMVAAEGYPAAERDALEARVDPGSNSFNVGAWIDPNNLAEAGWGVVFARGCDPEIKRALARLLKRRKEEADKHFRVFENEDAPAPAETAEKWLTRHGASLDLVDPANGVPFYLLLVGTPSEISYEFQYTLDIFWGVGRLCFLRPDLKPAIEEYSRYAESIVAYEKEDSAVPTKRQIALFATEHDFDAATQLFATKVARPLIDPASSGGIIGAREKFALRPFIGNGADRDTLKKILRGDIEGGAPAVLFSGTHGVEFPASDPQRQSAAQGALLCQDWSGYGAIEHNQWLEAADLPLDAKLHGLIHFCFACYSAGWPRFDNYARTAASPREIAAAAGLARLPQAMLAHPNGGALASIGHIDRAWSSSFVSERNRGQVQGFRSVLTLLLKGHRLGFATDQFNIRWSALSTDLTELLADKRNGARVPDAKLANRWVARDDARNYVVLGDPAVKLRVKDMPALGAPA